jgi:hypothetical protein
MVAAPQERRGRAPAPAGPPGCFQIGGLPKVRITDFMSELLSHPDLRFVTGLAKVLEISAAEFIRLANRELQGGGRRRRGATLRPGADTPLWQALAAAVRPHLRRRGTRALLARELGLHPSRVTEFFMRGTAMPDAERTLLVLLWLSRQESPAKGAATVRPDAPRAPSPASAGRRQRE